MTLAVSVLTDEGEAVAAGTVGTVVGIWGAGEAFTVEFADSIAGLADVKPDEIAEARSPSGRGGLLIPNSLERPRGFPSLLRASVFP